VSNAPTSISNPVFARVWKFQSNHETAWLQDRRRDNLEGLTGRVLEIGAGAGSNFEFYPATVQQVVAIEPEPRLREQARTAAEAAPVPVAVTADTVESLQTDEPFDAVVCSLVLCSIDDLETVLGGLLRQLRPGGELRYLEHVASRGARGVLQRGVDATFWPRLFGNCRTHRDTEAAITAAGFSLRGARRGHQFPKWVPLPVSEFALGRAVRP
jgi:protein-L-isoaspartate O-methyltransferase